MQWPMQAALPSVGPQSGDKAGIVLTVAPGGPRLYDAMVEI